MSNGNLSVTTQATDPERIAQIEYDMANLPPKKSRPADIRHSVEIE